MRRCIPRPQTHTGSAMPIFQAFFPPNDRLNHAKPPKKVLKELEGIRRKFLWGGNEDKTKISWLKWDDVLAPKSSGGLGVGAIRDANIALLSKWIWKYRSQNGSLWARSIKAIHFQPRRHKVIPVKLSLSGVWKHITCVDKELKKDEIELNKIMVAKVGNGGSTYFWKDVWVGNISLMEVCPALYNLESKKHCLVKDRGTFSNGVMTWSWDWRQNPTSIQALYELQVLRDMLQNVVLNQVEDVWRWVEEPEGCFSSRSLRVQMEMSRTPVDLSPIVWLRWAPLSVLCFIWRARLNRIPNKVLLRQRGVHLSSVECSACFGSEEDTDHVLLSCPFAEQVWSRVIKWSGVDFPINLSFREVIDFPFGLHQVEAKKRVGYIIAMATSWWIWKVRNDFIFNNIKRSVDMVVDNIITSTYAWMKFKAKKEDVVWQNWFSNPML